MTRTLPSGSDLDAWVDRLARSSQRQGAKQHLLRAGATALPAIRRGAQHHDPVVRRVCVAMLDRLVDTESVGDLVDALDDEDVEVRRRALHALACDACKENECRPGEDLWVPRALALLNDRDPDLRAAAIDALGKVAGHREDVSDALSTAAERDPDRGLRGMARRSVH
jgi:HEAT repeat protein